MLGLQKKIPRIFLNNKAQLDETLGSGDCQFSFPIIDLNGIVKDAALRTKAIEKIRDACENWGFFQRYYDELFKMRDGI